MARPRAIAALDVLIAALVLGGIVVSLTGGFYAEPFGTRVSIRKPGRTLALAAILGLVRWRMRAGRGQGFLGVPIDRYRRAWRALFRADADPAPGSAPRLGWRPFLAAVAGIAAMGAVLLREQLADLHLVADLGDPLFSIWRMGWVFRQIGGDPRPLFDANIFHPTPLTLTLSDSMLLPSLMGSPLLWAGVAPTVAYNVVLLSGFLLSGLGVFLLARRLTGSAPAAFVAGALYAFYPYRYEHYSHLELEMTQWMPLALWFLHRFWETRRPREAMGAALCLVAQLYSSMYYGVFFVFFASAIAGTWYAVARPGWRTVAMPLVASGAVLAILALPLARPYLAAQAMKGEREPWAVEFYSADASDYLRPHTKLGTWAGRLLPDVNPERSLFPGLSPIVVGVIGLWPPLGTARLAYGAGMAVAYDMSRGMKGTLYPFFYEWLPPMRGMRVPARFAVILGLGLVVFAAFGVRRLLARVRAPGARAAVLAVLLAAIAIDLQPALNLQRLWPEPPTIYRHLAGRTDVVLAEFPFEATIPVVQELPFMYFSVWHGLPIVNGYSGFTPSDHQQLVDDMREFPRERALAALRARGVTHVTANCAMMPERCAAFLDDADASPALRPVAEEQWEGHPVKLYELVR
jgi:hypothetical protein